MCYGIPLGVILVIGGDYRGNYLLAEKIRTGENRIDIKTIDYTIDVIADKIMEIEFDRDKDKRNRLKDQMKHDLNWMDTLDSFKKSIWNQNRCGI